MKSINLPTNVKRLVLTENRDVIKGYGVDADGMHSIVVVDNHPESIEATYEDADGNKVTGTIPLTDDSSVIETYLNEGLYPEYEQDNDDLMKNVVEIDSAMNAVRLLVTSTTDMYQAAFNSMCLGYSEEDLLFMEPGLCAMNGENARNLLLKLYNHIHVGIDTMVGSFTGNDKHIEKISKELENGADTKIAVEEFNKGYMFVNGSKMEIRGSELVTSIKDTCDYLLGTTKAVFSGAKKQYGVVKEIVESENKLDRKLADKKLKDINEKLPNNPSNGVLHTVLLKDDVLVNSPVISKPDVKGGRHCKIVELSKDELIKIINGLKSFNTELLNSFDALEKLNDEMENTVKSLRWDEINKNDYCVLSNEAIFSTAMHYVISARNAAFLLTGAVASLVSVYLKEAKK